MVMVVVRWWCCVFFFFFKAEAGIQVLVRSGGLEVVYKGRLFWRAIPPSGDGPGGSQLTKPWKTWVSTPAMRMTDSSSEVMFSAA